MIAAAYICLAIVAGVTYRWWTGRKPLAERVVDRLFAVSRRAQALAVAADQGLIAHRETMDDLRARHVPQYEGVR